MSTPARLWRDLPPEKRLAVADAFWRDERSQEIHAPRVEAIVIIAKRLNFRGKSVQALPVEKRAKYLAQMADVSESIATHALIAYHFAAQRPLMGAFLDAVGIPHENGLITEEQVAAPDRAKLVAAAETVRTAFPADDLEIYLRTLLTLDGETWKALETVLPLARS
jgi:hypothetical protein